MNIETLKNALSRELDWDNYLICGVGDLHMINNGPSGTATAIDMNGDSHTFSSGTGFSVSWKIPKRGKLFSVGQYVDTARPHQFGNGYSHGYKRASSAVMGCCKISHIASTISAKTGIFTLTAADGSTVFSWNSPAMWRTSDSSGGSVGDVPLSYELGVECDVGMSLSTSETYPVIGEPGVTSIGAIMFVPYKEQPVTSE